MGCNVLGEKEEYRTIKVKEGTYQKLKSFKNGISRAVDVLLKVQQQKIEEKLEDLRGMSESIAEVLFRYGVFDIQFKGATIEKVIEDGDMITIEGRVNILIPHEEVRAKILEILRGGEDVGGGNQGTDASNRGDKGQS